MVATADSRLFFPSLASDRAESQTWTSLFGIMFNCCHFLTYEFPILMEDIPLETRPRIFFMLDEVHPEFGQVTTYLNQDCENRWIGRAGPITWQSISPDLTLFHLFLSCFI
jgi:hypothetical protein